VSRDETAAWSKRTMHDRRDSETRRLLLAAAEKIMSELGFAEASVGRIAEAAGVSRATFYVYFESRKEVMTILVEDLMAGSRMAQRAADVDPSDPVAVVTSSVSTILRLFADRAALIRAFEQQATYDGEVRALWVAFHDAQVRRAASFIRRCQRSGTIRRGPSPEFLGECLVSLSLHFGLREDRMTSRRLRAVTEQLVDTNLRMMGLR
jgi:AcrR family transcriptional regulator